MQTFIHFKTTLHVSGVTASIIRSIKNCTRSLRYMYYDLYRRLRVQFLILLMMDAVTPETCRLVLQWIPIRPRWRGVAVQVVRPVPEAAGTVLIILMTGAVTPETCRVVLQWINICILLHLLDFYSHWIRMHGTTSLKCVSICFSLVAKRPSRHTISYFLDSSDIRQRWSCSMLSALYTENAAMRNYRTESRDTNIFQVIMTMYVSLFTRRYDTASPKSRCECECVPCEGVFARADICITHPLS